MKLGSENIAHVRLDRHPGDPSRAELGIALHESVRGNGWGLPVLRSALAVCEALGIVTVEAEIHRENAASMVVFEACGFSAAGECAGDLVQLVLDLG